MDSYNHAPLDFARCGTLANWRRHYRLGESACEKCKVFARWYFSTEQRRQRRGKAAKR